MGGLRGGAGLDRIKIHFMKFYEELFLKRKKGGKDTMTLESRVLLVRCETAHTLWKITFNS